MKKLKVILAGLSVLAAVFAMSFANTAWAASCRVYFSDPTVTVGDTVTYDTGSLEFLSVSGGNSSGGGGSVMLDNDYSSGSGSMSFSISFRTLRVGSSSITCTGYDIVDAGGEPMSVTMGSSLVTVQAAPTASSDATLSSLSISPGSLSPSFSSSTTSYSASVSNSVTSVAVSASKNHSGASVSVSGTSDLSVGANTVYITVTAEDGSTQKTYTITVTRAAASSDSTDPETETETESPEEEEPGKQEATVTLEDGTVLKAVDFEDTAVPVGFKTAELDFNGTKQKVIQLKSGDIYAVYLEGDETHPAGFYFYNASTGAVRPMTSVAMAESSLTILDPTEQLEIPEGYQLSKEQIGDADYTVLIPRGIKAPNHCLVYALNGKGETGLYLYDMEEKTFQRYQFAVVSEEPEEPAEPVEPEPEPVPEEEPEPEPETLAVFGWDTGLPVNPSLLAYIILGAALLILVLAVVVVILAVRLSRKKKGGVRPEDTAPAAVRAGAVPPAAPKAVRPSSASAVPKKPAAPRPQTDTAHSGRTNAGPKKEAFTLEEIMSEYSGENPNRR